MSEARTFDSAPSAAAQARTAPERDTAPRGTQSMAQGQNGAQERGQEDAQPLGKIGQEAVSQAQEQAVKIVSQAKQQVSASVSSQTSRASRIAGVVGASLHDAGNQLREQDERAVAKYIDQAADQVEHVATMLNEQDIGQLLRTVQQFAKREPVLFFASAVVVGALGARFLRSSSPPERASRPAPDAYAGLRAMEQREALWTGA